MAEALAQGAPIKSPRFRWWPMCWPRPISDPAEIVRRLVEQVTGTVRWRECVAFMAGHGVTTFYEVGAGKVLSGLVKRIAAGATGIASARRTDIAAFKARAAEGDKRCSI